MKIVIISDTHHQHKELGPMDGDLLIHCGDMFTLPGGHKDEIARLDDWFGELRFKHILCVDGNHDHSLENAVAKESQPFRNAVLLQDDSIQLNGLTFYGAPWVPRLRGHAFYQSDDNIACKWDLIPSKVDILITHTPPANVLDTSSSGIRFGCAHLSRALKRIRPRLHCFGHVHASAGTLTTPHTKFVNACSVNSKMELAHKPFEIEL